MRIVSLSLLLASVSALAAPGLAQDMPAKPPQEAPAPVPAPAREAPPPPPIIAMAPPVEEPAVAIPAVWAPVPTDAEGRSAYGLYLAGRSAISRGDAAIGAAYLQAAYDLTPEQPALRDHAFTAALFSGDLDFAARTTPSGEGVSPVLTEAGRLIEMVQIYEHGDARGALAIFDRAPIGQPHARAGLYVRAFIAAAAGERDTALAIPVGPANDATVLFARYHRALLLEHYGEFDEAEREYAFLMGHRAASLFRLQYGEYLERRRRGPEAVALYDAAIAAGTADDRYIEARARAAARRRPPAAPSLREGAAIALKDAAIQASVDGAHEFAAVYLRMALELDPQDDTRLRLGQTLAEAKIEPLARDALNTVTPADAALYAAARSEIARSFQREERPEEALIELQRAQAATPADAQIAYMLAAQLVELKRYDEGLAILNGPLLNTANQDFGVHFLRGAAYESKGDVALAEAELWAAHQLEPQDPTVLNYLGYLWVDSGLRVEQGAGMIAQAFAAEPDNGNIQDSLGWAQYRQGLYDDAVASLEAAVAKEPANAEVNDHLGDAYWQVGRKREAQFQWRRVLTLDPDAEQRADAERKLAEGLAPATPVSDGAEP